MQPDNLQVPFNVQQKIHFQFIIMQRNNATSNAINRKTNKNWDTKMRKSIMVCNGRRKAIHANEICIKFRTAFVQHSSFGNTNEWKRQETRDEWQIPNANTERLVSHFISLNSFANQSAADIVKRSRCALNANFHHNNISSYYFPVLRFMFRFFASSTAAIQVETLAYLIPTSSSSSSSSDYPKRKL